MRLKSFFSDTVDDAIAQARREMGADAMLVNSKPSSAEARHLGAYEVVVCSEEHEAAAERRASRQTSDSPFMDHLSRDVSDLKLQMERLALTLARSGSGLAGISSDPQRAKLFADLCDSELDADLACEVLGNPPFPASEAAVRAALESLIQVDQEIGCRESPTRIVALIGPPGSGKTSCLVKLLVQYGIRVQRSSQVLTVDTYRIGAADQLRSYAAILGVGCEVLESAAGLAQALEQYRHKELILIDTPGLSRHEMDDYAEVRDLLRSYPGIDTHLVVAASMRAADLKRMIGQYAAFNPRKLLFTRLDETETFGPILSQSVRSNLSLSFFCDGQRIPEDLHPATPDLVLGSVMKRPADRSLKFDKAAA